MCSLKYPTIAQIPTDEDDGFCHEPILPGSEVLLVQLENGEEQEFPLPERAQSYQLRVIGAAVVGKFFGDNGEVLSDSEFSI